VPAPGLLRLQLKWFSYAAALSLGLMAVLRSTWMDVLGADLLGVVEQVLARPACRCGCGIRPEGVRGEAGRAHSPVRYQRF